jgi:hypothetical protein
MESSAALWSSTIIFPGPTTNVTASSASLRRTSSVAVTKIFIDRVPEYSQLSKCAETRLSRIVRNMETGCGDDSQTTSYSCFCYDSSSFFRNMIGTQVTCSDQMQVTSAQNVFDKYCQMGLTMGVTPARELISFTFARVFESLTTAR